MVHNEDDKSTGPTRGNGYGERQMSMSPVKQVCRAHLAGIYARSTLVSARYGQQELAACDCGDAGLTSGESRCDGLDDRDLVRGMWWLGARGNAVSMRPVLFERRAALSTRRVRNHSRIRQQHSGVTAQYQCFIWASIAGCSRPVCPRHGPQLVSKRSGCGIPHNCHSVSRCIDAHAAMEPGIVLEGLHGIGLRVSQDGSKTQEREGVG